MAEFKKGDVVRLKSGGPVMTVNDPNSKDAWGNTGLIKCIFFDGSTLHEETFIPEVIQVSEVY